MSRPLAECSMRIRVRRFRQSVKDPDLKDAIREIKGQARDLSPDESRAWLVGLIDSRYTAPAEEP